MNFAANPQTNRAQLLFSGDAYFQILRRNIREAKREVLLECYIFDFDPVGRGILHELADAVKRGVRVRLLIDGIGSFNWLRQIQMECERQQILLQIFHPVPFQGTLTRRLSWRNLRKLLFLFRQTNKRNHRKTLITDQSRVVLGSFNISQVHSERFSGEYAWRDSGLAFEFVEYSGDLMVLRKAFLRSWSRARWSHAVLTRRDKNSSNRPQKSLFRLNDGFRKRLGLSSSLKKRIHNAQVRILITTPYFLPRRSHYRAILAAAKRGVYVALLLPAKNDVGVVKLASQILYRKMIDSGVQIYEYQPRVLHSKTLVIDDWAILGSSNFNHRSFVHDLEIEAVVSNPSMVGTLLQQWDQDIENSCLITWKDFSLSWWRQWIGRFLFAFRFWL
ncbi:MAG: phosphatidylserine/phosphatidylglycerophosphate/cardiolipin synthase family protein [Bdellovibrio sp.]